MWRATLIFLLLLVLLAPFAAERLTRRATSAPAASAGADLRLVVITPNNQDIRREIARAFSAWHRDHYGRGVNVDFRTPGGTNDVVHLLNTAYDLQRDGKGNLPPEKQSRADIDVVWGGGDFTYYHDLKGLLQPIQLEDRHLLAEAFPELKLAGVRLLDDYVDPLSHQLAPHWLGVCLSSFGLVYNPELYSTLGLAPPSRWQDLGDPRLNGWVALADPTKSGSAAVAYEMVLQRAMADAEDSFRQTGAPLDKKSPAYQRAIADGWHRGMGQLLLIAANARYFTDSATDPPNDVGNGEAAAGVAIDFYARTFEEQLGSSRIRYVAPRAATAVTPDGVAILYGVKGERQLVARRFIQFQLTREGQLLWALRTAADGGGPGSPRDRALHRAPIRRDLYAAGVDHSRWADAINPFAEAGNFNQRGEWMGLFGDTRAIWAAAWIDGRDELRTAYSRVLAVPDDARRRDLLERLADLPIAMSDVAAMRDERSALEQNGGDSDLWKARTRQRWAQIFRNHYANVGSPAGSVR